MPYIMHLYIDGGCRRNGYSDAIGAAACVWKSKFGGKKIFERYLPSNPQPTSQRAELRAVILGLETAWDRILTLKRNPYVVVWIHTDSKYVVGCMTEWKTKWLDNGFINLKGTEVTNGDLIRKAYALQEKVEEVGCVEYTWISREANQDADDAVNGILDDME